MVRFYQIKEINNGYYQSRVGWRLATLVDSIPEGYRDVKFDMYSIYAEDELDAKTRFEKAGDSARKGRGQTYLDLILFLLMEQESEMIWLRQHLLDEQKRLAL